MLEICPPAPCSYGLHVPRRGGTATPGCAHSGAVAMRYRTTSPGASLRTVGCRHPRATYVESSSCTNPCGTSVESYSCEKSRAALAPSRATQRLRAAKRSKIGVTARGFAARPRGELWSVQTRQAGSQSPLESALTPKNGWGVPPPLGFLR
jgi:hypothetical protein